MAAISLCDSVFVRRSAADVFDYAAEFRRAAEWRTEVVESWMTPPGPMRAGSVLREVAEVAGRRVVTDSVVEEFVARHRWTFRHQAGPLPVSGSYTVVAAEGGAVLRYELTAELHGGWALLAPILRLTGPRMVADSLDEFRFRLEASALPLAS